MFCPGSHCPSRLTSPLNLRAFLPCSAPRSELRGGLTRALSSLSRTRPNFDFATGLPRGLASLFLELHCGSVTPLALSSLWCPPSEAGCSLPSKSLADLILSWYLPLGRYKLTHSSTLLFLFYSHRRYLYTEKLR